VIRKSRTDTVAQAAHFDYLNPLGQSPVQRMNFNLTTVLRIAVITLACVCALLIGTLASSGSLAPIGIALGIGLIVVTCLCPGWLVVICIAFSLLTGRMGLGVGYWEILATALIARWLLIVPFRGGLFGRINGKLTFICIAGFTLILFAHGLPALMGVSDSTGRRPAVLAIASLGLTYLLLSGKLDLSKITWLPWVGLIPGIIAASFDLINLAIPAALPITFFLYNDQNWEMVAEYQGMNVGLLRISGFRELGLGIAFLSLTYFAYQRTAHFRLLALEVFGTMVGGILAAAAGYRSYVAQIALGTLIAAYSRSKATLVVLSLCIALGLGALLLIHSEVAELPLPMQRALSFLPGDWDWRTKTAAEGGFEWRRQLRDYYFTRIFPDSWLLGRGLCYDERTQAMTWMMSSEELNIEYFVMLQNYHSGLVSALDYVGVVGTCFLIIGSLRAFWNAFLVYRRRHSSKPWHFWIATMFVTASPAYWYTGFFDRIFPFFVMAMGLLEIARREIESTEAAAANKAAAIDYNVEMIGAR